MTNHTPISLQKAEENVRISLKKRSILTPPTCAVGLALDVSGSTTTLYNNGSMSKAVTRALGLAKTFDDNGEMDMWTFNEDSEKLENATEENYLTFVQDEIISQHRVQGGTVYSHALHDIVDFYFPHAGAHTTVSHTVESVAAPVKGFFSRLFGSKQEAPVSTGKQTVIDEAASNADGILPAFCIFLTDGENAVEDRSSADHAFERSADHPIYWLLVGVGKDVSKFKYLKDTAAKYKNVGYLQFDNLDMDDETLYDGVISQKFADWAKSL